MSIHKFYCKCCDYSFEKDSDGFFVSYGCVLETNCPMCGNDINNITKENKYD